MVLKISPHWGHISVHVFKPLQRTFRQFIQGHRFLSTWSVNMDILPWSRIVLFFPRYALWIKVAISHFSIYSATEVSHLCQRRSIPAQLKKIPMKLSKHQVTWNEPDVPPFDVNQLHAVKHVHPASVVLSNKILLSSDGHLNSLLGLD